MVQLILEVAESILGRIHYLSSWERWVRPLDTGMHIRLHLARC